MNFSSSCTGKCCSQCMLAIAMIMDRLQYLRTLLRDSIKWIQQYQCDQRVGIYQWRQVSGKRACARLLATFFLIPSQHQHPRLQLGPRKVDIPTPWTIVHGFRNLENQFYSWASFCFHIVCGTPKIYDSFLVDTRASGNASLPIL